MNLAVYRELEPAPVELEFRSHHVVPVAVYADYPSTGLRGALQHHLGKGVPGPEHVRVDAVVIPSAAYPGDHGAQRFPYGRGADMVYQGGRESGHFNVAGVRRDFRYAVYEMAVDKAGSQVPFGKFRMAQNAVGKIDIGVDPLDVIAVQGFDEADAGFFTGIAVTDDLGQHGIVVDPDPTSCRHPAVDPDVFPPWFGIAGYHPGCRDESPGGHFRADTGLYGPAVEGKVLLFEGEALAVGDPQLKLHQVQAGDLFRYGVLDLEPRVHFKKIEITPGVQHEFHGPRIHITRLAGQVARGLPHFAPQVFGHRRGR